MRRYFDVHCVSKLIIGKKHNSRHGSQTYSSMQIKETLNLTSDKKAMQNQTCRRLRYKSLRLSMMSQEIGGVYKCIHYTSAYISFLENYLIVHHSLVQLPHSLSQNYWINIFNLFTFLGFP